MGEQGEEVEEMGGGEFAEEETEREEVVKDLGEVPGGEVVAVVEGPEKVVFGLIVGAKEREGMGWEWELVRLGEGGGRGRKAREENERRVRSRPRRCPLLLDEATGIAS